MNILFVHHHFPGQLGALALRLAASKRHRVAGMGSEGAQQLPGIPLIRYKPRRGSTPGLHPFASRFEIDCIRGEAAAGAARHLAGRGFTPDLIVGHVGWGEPLFMKDVWPLAKQLVYAEYYYHGRGTEVDFDREYDSPEPGRDMRVRAKNAGMALMVAEADAVIAPTEWQRAQYPEPLRARIQVMHEGIDTTAARPRPDARVKLPNSDRVLTAGDEVLTYINRGLEPMRGLHIFLRSLPDILNGRPKAEVVIVGAEEVTPYMTAQGGQTHKQALLAELGSRIDSSRVHWLGYLDMPDLLDVLAISKVHVYLTYPFVLSWSMLQAMSTGCIMVASDTPPVREVIEHGRNGFLVPFFDQQALARQVIDVLGRPRSDFAALGAAARSTVVQRFDRNEVCLPRMIALVESLGTSLESDSNAPAGLPG